VADLESGILTGTVTGYFYIGDPDSPDAGTQADLGLINGTITVSPTLSPPYTRTANGLLFLRSGTLQVINSVLHGPKPLDGSTTPAAVGATLIATDQAGLNPNNFQWTATFNFVGVNPSPSPVTFSLPAGANVDLSLQYNAPSSTPALQVVVSEASKNAAAQSASDAAASAAAAQAAVDSPGRVGPPGPQGPPGQNSTVPGPPGPQGVGVLVLGPTDPVPGGTPSGTVIVRTSP